MKSATIASPLSGSDADIALRPTAIVIGASTGGPQALPVVIHDLAALIPFVPVLIALHIPPEFTQAVATRIEKLAGHAPLIPHDGAPLTAGHVYLSPGDRHLALGRCDGKVVIKLLDTPPENFCKPSIDVLFRSAADAFGAGLVAIVLTGMGSDGLAGTRAIASAGGKVIAQDANTSAVWGVPRLVANEGLANAVLPLKEIGGWVCRQTRGSLRRESQS